MGDVFYRTTASEIGINLEPSNHNYTPIPPIIPLIINFL